MDLTNTLLVDVGNTNTKLRTQSKDIIIANNNLDTSLIPEHKNSIISCVADTKLIDNFNNPTLAIPQKYKDIEFNYNLQELGVDRYLAIIAGYNLYPNKDIMIIDIGTFITIETLSVNNQYFDGVQYFSGGIAPGFDTLKSSYKFNGEDSQLNVELGLANMIIAYVSYSINNSGCDDILITGGSWVFFEQAVLELCSQNNIIYHDNLVLDGLKFYADAFL
jgi:pantothenate kinase type III